jgi:hypothetical protein
MEAGKQPTLLANPLSLHRLEKSSCGSKMLLLDRPQDDT